MLDAWLNRPRAAGPAEALVSLPEQEFAAWALNNAARRAGPGLLVTIIGEPGAGKSSLVRQMLRQLGSTLQKKALFLSAAQWPQFVAEFPESEELLDQKQKPQLVVIEDLPELPSPDLESERLAAWIDRWRPTGISLVLTSDRLPCEIPELSPRLRNRLQGGLLAGIRSLSVESQQQLWQRWAAELVLPAWQSNHVPAGVLTAGQLKVWAANCRETATSTPAIKTVSLEAIAQAVAEEFGISVDALESGGRAVQLRNPRCVAMSLARELTPLSLSTISRYFGCRSHTTVARSGQRLEHLIQATPALSQQVQALRTRLRQQAVTECG